MQKRVDRAAKIHHSIYTLIFVAMSLDSHRLFIAVVLLIDSLLWGVWFGGFWSYRLAFASRLTSDYIHISVSYALPMFASSIAFLVAVKRHRFIRSHRIYLFKLSVVLSRILYIASAILVIANVFESLKLLYTTTLVLSMASGLGSIAGVAWTDYIADIIPENWKPRYVALDSLLGTAGALAGSALAGYIFVSETGITSYGKLFLVSSLIFSLDIPLIMMLGDSPYPLEARGRENRISNFKPGALLYAAIALLYLALNLPTSLTAPYIIYRLGGNELWITAMNISNFVASFLMPIALGEALKSVKPLTLARISIAVSAISTAVFPHLKSVELQTIRAFVAGASGIGIWMSILSHIIADVDPEYRIQHSSIIYLIQNIAPATATSIGGLLAETLKSPETVFYMSTISIASIPMIKVYGYQNKNKTTKQ